MYAKHPDIGNIHHGFGQLHKNFKVSSVFFMKTMSMPTYDVLNVQRILLLIVSLLIIE